jgi:hypothetical protein
MTYAITESEASSLKDFIEYYFIQSIRDDEEVDSLLYVYNIMNVYAKIGGLEEFADYEPFAKRPHY